MPIPTVSFGQPTSDALQLIIAEQTGDQRTLTLAGRALPYRPVAFAGEQAEETTRYPGNPVKTQQILGPDEEPTEMSGYWKDRFINDPLGKPASYTQNGKQSSLLNVVDLVNLVDDIRRKGQQVVVQWGPIVRRGLLKRFEQRWFNIHDVQFTIRFVWISQDDPEVPAVMSKDTDYANALGTLDAYMQSIQTIIDDVEDQTGAQIGQYQVYQQTLQGLVDQFNDTTANALDTIMPIVDQQRRLAGILGDIANEAAVFSTFVTSLPASLLALPTAGASVEGAGMAAEWTLRQFVSTLRDVGFSALETQQDLLKSISPDILVSFTARNNTDLRDVAIEFYGVPDDWRSIMVFNNLTDSRLSSGQTIFVPKLIRPLDGSQ